MARPKPITPAEADLAYAAAQHVVEVHRRLARWLEPGQTMAQIDAFVASTLEELRCRSCFLGYKVPRAPAFPSHACLSVNDCIVHGTAGSYTLPTKFGDVLKIDIGVTFRGWIGDAAWTYVFGEPSPEVRRLCDTGKESLRRGIDTLRVGTPLIEWARAVQGCVEVERKLHLVRGLGGHGYGRTLHAPPFVSNVIPAFAGDWPDASTRLAAGTLVAVEPMLALGTGETRHHRGTWPVYTADGSLSAHYEHDVLVTEEGPRVLSEGLDALEDVIR
ncbi:MAG: type I methionyl aminopeptidase [Phycisphaeraceae bacterium]|nr:type I methionyl aminopeptidase [Phycisphaeraceae bacterium]